MSGGKVVVCGECGMLCGPAEYHPYAACLMFKGCHNSATVRANLAPFAAAIARAEAAEAKLDHIARVGKSSRKQTQRTKWIVARAISALNGDDEWMSAMKPKGYHDALDRAAIAAQQAEGG